MVARLAASSMQPKKFGCWTTMQAVVSSTAAARSCGFDDAVGRADGDQLDAEVCQICGDRLAILGMHARGGDDSAVSLRAADGHQHGFGRGAAAVVEAGVGDIQAGEPCDQRLILEDDLQVALADFGLVGRVRRVELAAAGELVDDGGNEVVVAAAAEEADFRVCVLVLGGERASCAA